MGKVSINGNETNHLAIRKFVEWVSRNSEEIFVCFFCLVIYSSFVVVAIVTTNPVLIAFCVAMALAGFFVVMHDKIDDFRYGNNK